MQHGKQRPPTPFELVEGGDSAVTMRKLWKDMHPMFAKCIGKIESVQIKNHAERGMVGIYFGRIVSHNNVEMHGHYMMRHSDQKVIKVRSVVCYPPLQPKPQPSLKLLSSGSGGAEEYGT